MLQRSIILTLLFLLLFLPACVTTGEVTQKHLARHYQSAVFAYGDTLYKWTGNAPYRIVYDQQADYDRWQPTITKWMKAIGWEAGVFFYRKDDASDFTVSVEIRDSEHSDTSKRTHICTVRIVEHEGQKIFRKTIAAQMPASKIEICIPHEVVHLLSIWGHSIHITPTIPNPYDDHNSAKEPRWYDLAVLRIHGDDRIKGSMTKSEAMPIVRQIIAERWDEFRNGS